MNFSLHQLGGRERVWLVLELTKQRPLVLSNETFETFNMEVIVVVVYS